KSKRVHYPESDGRPMAENTLQFQWIVTLKTNLDWTFRERADVLVAGDLLWYPVEGQPKVNTAPDVLVALGRPGGHRGSYKQWEEGGQPPHVVIEVLSPSNRMGEMIRKFKFYERHGVEEYFVIDPDRDPETLNVYQRQGQELREVDVADEWVSPLLGVRFVLDEGLHLYHPDGERFATFAEVRQRAAQAQQQAEQAQQQAQQAQQQAQQAQQQAQQAQQQAQQAQQQAEQAQQQAQQAQQRVAQEQSEKERALAEVAALQQRLREAGLG
ncbi:MAG: Uma2 family endonuclease, partial [Catalinimonas sp.]